MNNQEAGNILRMAIDTIIAQEHITGLKQTGFKETLTKGIEALDKVYLDETYEPGTYKEKSKDDKR